MGREIRRVPLDWQHPTDEDGEYIPMFDRTYEEALADWREYESSDPNYKPLPIAYRPAYTSEPIGYQVYENVTEGSPQSPVFASKEEMRQWLLEQGHSEHAVDSFIASGYAPSFVMNMGKGFISRPGIDSYDMLPGEDE